MPQGRDTRPVKCLAHVDIAKPGDDPLVQKGRLDRRAFAREGAREVILVERVAKRFRAQPAEQPSARSTWSVGERSMAPKRRASLKVMRAAGLGVEHDVVVLLGRGMGVVEDARHGAGRIARRDDHAAGHAEIG